MKKNILKSLAMLLIGVVTFTACDNDDDIKLPPTSGGGGVELDDGYYVFSGAISDVQDITDMGEMIPTYNEMENSVEGRTTVSTLLETYMEVKASDGFYIAYVSSGAVSYIGSSDLAMIAEGDLDVDEPQNGLYKGTTNFDSTLINVNEDGIYHVAISTDLSKISVAKADWGVIGSASPEGWGSSTAFDQVTVGTDKIEWTGKDITMKAGAMKFRYSNGWKILMDDTYPNAGDELGLKLNTNVGGPLDALLPGGSDAAWEDTYDPAIYDMTLTWMAGEGFKFVATKKGNVAVTDWSDIKFDVFGTGVVDGIADPSSWGWGNAVTAEGPAVYGEVAEGAVFTWTWSNVNLKMADKEGFAFRSIDGENYNGTVFRYEVIDSAKADLALVTPTTNDYGDVNFNVTTDQAYDIQLVINAADKDKAYVTIVKTGETIRPAVYYDLVGGAVKAENTGAIADPFWTWGSSMISDNNGAISGTTVTWTNAMVAADGMKIRKIKCGGVDGEFSMSNYNAEGSTDGLVSGDNNITVAAEGTITFVLDLEAGTFTVN